eukprot:9528141-Heterocapsa_arctica.AAC.1
MVTADHVILAEPDAGMQGERAGMVVSDMGTDSLAFYSMQRKTLKHCPEPETVLREAGDVLLLQRQCSRAHQSGTPPC